MSTIFRICRSSVLTAVVMSVCLLTTATAMTMKEMMERGMKRTKVERGFPSGRERRATDPKSCAVPSDLNARFLEANEEVTQPQVLNIINNVPVSQITDDICLVPKNHSPLAVADQCPCPYFLTEFHLDEGYYPSSLRMGRCWFQTCLQMSIFGCRVVNAPITVLRLDGCDGGVQTYKNESVLIAIGCACDLRGTTQTMTSTSDDEKWWVE